MSKEEARMLAHWSGDADSAHLHIEEALAEYDQETQIASLLTLAGCAIGYALIAAGRPANREALEAAIKIAIVNTTDQAFDLKDKWDEDHAVH